MGFKDERVVTHDVEEDHHHFLRHEYREISVLE